MMPGQPRLTRIVWIAALTLHGCVEAPADRWAGSVDTLANGTVQVNNPETGVWTEDDIWRLVPDLRIGAEDGDTPDMFGEIGAIGESPNGLVHVIDAHSQEVRVFAANGQHVRTFGRRGAGPGEFARAHSLDWDPSGRLWIADPGNNRYAVFDTTGSLLFHLTRPVPGIVFPWLGGFARDSVLYDVAVSQLPNGITHFIYYGITASGAAADTLDPVEHRRIGPPLASMTLFWLTPRTSFSFDGRGYLFIVNTGDYRVIQRSLNGDTVRIIAREYTPTPVSAAQRDSIALELQTAHPDSRNPAIPDAQPAIERLFVDPDGTLYVKPFGTNLTSFDVFDAEGRFLGPMQSDIRFSMYPALPRFYGDRMYGVVIDSMGVQYVVRARINRQQR